METNTLITDSTGITRDWFLRTLLVHLALVNDAFLGTDVGRRYTRQVALSIGRTIEERYRAAHALTFPLPVAQFAWLLDDLRERIDGTFTVTAADETEVLLTAAHCPWKDVTTHIPSLCQVLVGIYSGLAASNFGYVRVRVEESSAEQPGCRLHLHLRGQSEGEVLVGEVFTREEVGRGPSADEPLPLVEMVRQYQRELEATRDEYEHLYRQQVELTGQLERALSVEREAAEQQRAFTRMKHDFLSNVSHELRTPITTIKGYISLLDQGLLGDLNAEQQEAAEISLRNLERLNRLVSDLLDFSALMRGELAIEAVAVDVAEFITHSMQQATPAAQLKGIALDSQLGDDLGMVRGDRAKLTQVVEHLLENAIKFTEPGQQVRLSAARHDGQVIIEVADTGIGMTPEQLQHVFTPFVQGESGLTRRYGGLGMGMSLIRNLIALHGGDISINSQPGAGTTVRVSLPAA